MAGDGVNGSSALPVFNLVPEGLCEGKMTFAEVIFKGELVFPFLLNFNLVAHMN